MLFREGGIAQHLVGGGEAMARRAQPGEQAVPLRGPHRVGVQQEDLGGLPVEQQVAGSMGVRSIPTIALFAGGEPKEVAIGVRPKEELKTMIDKHL